VQSALQAFENSSRSEAEHQRKEDGTSDDHMVLILDRKVQEIPWESIPVLRSRSVSRIPSFAFLLDRLALIEHRSAQRSGAGGKETAVDGPPRYVVDPRQTHYVLNPSKDLVRTQAHFEPWMRAMEQKSSWTGVMGVAPMELDMVKALETKELLL
jgi:separase